MQSSRTMQRGAVTLIAVILLITVVTFSVLTAALYTNTSMNDTLQQDNSVAALFLAESGLEHAIKNYSTTGVCDNTNVGVGTSFSLGRGSAQVVSVDSVTVAPLCRIVTYGTIGSVRRSIQADVRLGGATTFLSNTTATGNSATITVNVPAGVVANDLMLAAIAIRGGTGQTITAPAGWTLSPTNGRLNSGTTLAQALYYRVASGAEPASYTWTASTGNRFSAVIMAYRNVVTLTPIDVAGGQANAASTNATAPSVTTTVANTRLVSFFGRPNGNDTWTAAPGGMTQPFASFGSGGGPNGTELLVAHQTVVGIGATGVRTATASSSLVSIGQSIALRPSGVGGAGSGVVTWTEP